MVEQNTTQMARVLGVLGEVSEEFGRKKVEGCIGRGKRRQGTATPRGTGQQLIEIGEFQSGGQSREIAVSPGNLVDGLALSKGTNGPSKENE